MLAHLLPTGHIGIVNSSNSFYRKAYGKEVYSRNYANHSVNSSSLRPGTKGFTCGK